jgi:hypothetical protein
MLTLLSALGSMLSFLVRSRASLEAGDRDRLAS